MRKILKTQNAIAVTEREPAVGRRLSFYTAVLLVVRKGNDKPILLCSSFHYKYIVISQYGGQRSSPKPGPPCPAEKDLPTRGVVSNSNDNAGRRVLSAGARGDAT